MGFDQSRSTDSNDRESANDRTEKTDDFGSRGRSSGQSSRRQRKSTAEAHYGQEIDDPKKLAALQRLEQQYGGQVHGWLEEGIPMEAMGKPSKMEAFRQRKGTPVPWDIERQNERSRRRNTSSIQRRRREQPDGDTQVPDSVRDVISSPGQSLEASVQRAMEDRMGESFDDVRVHTGPTAAQACEDINARAFTVGNHVAFNRGEYDPESADGQHVIAHELAHVRQQTGGAVSMLPQEEVQLESSSGPQLEESTGGPIQRVRKYEEPNSQSVTKFNIFVQRTQDDTRSTRSGVLLQRVPEDYDPDVEAVVEEYRGEEINTEDTLHKIQYRRDDWDHSKLGNSDEEVRSSLELLLGDPDEVYEQDHQIELNGHSVEIQRTKYVKEMDIDGDTVLVFGLVSARNDDLNDEYSEEGSEVKRRTITAFVPTGTAASPDDSYEEVYDRERSIAIIKNNLARDQQQEWDRILEEEEIIDEWDEGTNTSNN